MRKLGICSAVSVACLFLSARVALAQGAPSASPEASSAPVTPTVVIVVVPAPPPSPPMPVPAPALPSVRVEVVQAGELFHVALTVADGSVRECDATHGHPCVLTGVPLGPARLRAAGPGHHEQSFDVDPSGNTIRLDHEYPRNGVVQGVVAIAVGLALGAAAIGLFVACSGAMSCENACTSTSTCMSDPLSEPTNAVVIPLALIAPTAVALGIAMLAWHQDARDGLDVLPGSEPEAVRDRRGAHPSFGIALVPVPDGAAFAATARF